MTNQLLAQYSNLSTYSAMAVLTVAMIAFAVDLARTLPNLPASVTTSSRTTTTTSTRPSTLVGALGHLDRASRNSDVPEADTLLAAPASGDPSDHRATPGTPGTPATSGASQPPRALRRSAGIAMALTWLGGGLAVTGVVLRGLSVARVPWGNMYEFATTGAAAVIAAYLVLSLRRDMRWLGIFVVGPSLLTLGLAVTVYYTQASQLLPALRSIWLVIHVSVAIVSIAVFTLAFSITIIYLIQARREDRRSGESNLTSTPIPAPHRGTAPASRMRLRLRVPTAAGTSAASRASFMDALPDAASLERTSYALHIVAFPLWTFTLIAGAIWAEEAWGAYWQWDPKEVWTFIIWVVYAAYLHARATGGWKRQRAALIACAGYACILINYMVVNVYFVGMHSYSGM